MMCYAMKKRYIEPAVVLVSVDCPPLAAGSTGDAVNEDGTEVNLSGIRQKGNAAGAASRCGGYWDGDE